MISNVQFKYKCDDRINMVGLCETDFGDNILISHIATVVNGGFTIRKFIFSTLFVFFRKT